LPAITEPSLSLIRAVALVIFAVAIFVAGLFHTNPTVDIISGSIGIGSLIIGMAFEIYGANSRYETAVREVKTELQRLEKRLGEVGISDPQLTLLRPRDGLTPIQRFWRCTILELAIRYVDHGRVRLEGHEETQLRIKYLGQAIRESTKFAFAYTYGTKRYFEEFWCHEANTEDYFRAHQYALDKRSAPDLRRVFVVTEELLADPAIMEYFTKVIRDHARYGLKEIYITTEERARQTLGEGFPARSFLVADNEFVSEGGHEGGKPMGYVGYKPQTAANLRATYLRLQQSAGRPLSKEEIQNPWIRLARLGKQPPLAS
jgi:hypothetical protein